MAVCVDVLTCCVTQCFLHGALPVSAGLFEELPNTGAYQPVVLGIQLHRAVGREPEPL